jgi:hypothetical protein
MELLSPEELPIRPTVAVTAAALVQQIAMHEASKPMQFIGPAQLQIHES